MKNERIQELAYQAGFETDRGPLIVPGPYIKVGGLCVGVPLEKFAELIVKECATQINQMHRHARTTNLRNYENACIADAIRTIKEHFGVE